MGKRIMGKSFAFVVFALACAAGGTGGARAQAPVFLPSLRPVAGGLGPLGAKVSLAGRICRDALASAAGPSDFAVYDLAGRYVRFRAWVGIPDDYADVSGARYRVSVDGKVVLDNVDQPLSSGDPPVLVDLDVTGARSLTVKLMHPVVFGDPELIRPVPRPVARPAGGRLTTRLKGRRVRPQR